MWWIIRCPPKVCVIYRIIRYEKKGACCDVTMDERKLHYTKASRSEIAPQTEDVKRNFSHPNRKYQGMWSDGMSCMQQGAAWHDDNSNDMDLFMTSNAPKQNSASEEWYLWLSVKFTALHDRHWMNNDHSTGCNDSLLRQHVCETSYSNFDCLRVH